MEAKRYFSREEVAKHNTAEDCYTIVGNVVYDMTHYLDKHPGGYNLLFRNAGKDSTKDFEAMYHSQRARKLLEQYVVGELVKSAVPPNLMVQSGGYPPPFPRKNTTTNPILNVVSNNTYSPLRLTKSNSGGQLDKSTVSPPKAEITNSPIRSVIPTEQISIQISQQQEPETLSKNTFQKYKCCAIQFISHDTAIFKFKLHAATSKIQIKEGRHVQIAVYISRDEGKTFEQVVRKYTPIRSEKGSFELLVKKYPGGALSTFFHLLNLGDEILMRGPFGSFKNGKKVRLQYTTNYLFCAGTGVAPMWQIIQKNLMKKSRIIEPTKFILIYSNKTEDDILLRAEIELMAVDFVEKLQVIHLLSQAQSPKDKNPNLYETSNVSYLYKKLDSQVLENELEFSSKVNSESRVLVCGPDGYCEMIRETMLQFGFQPEQIHVF